MRNELAHKSEPVGLDDRIDDFVASVEWSVREDVDRQRRVEWAFFVLFEAVSSLVEEADSAE